MSTEENATRCRAWAARNVKRFRRHDTRALDGFRPTLRGSRWNPSLVRHSQSAPAEPYVRMTAGFGPESVARWRTRPERG